MTVDPEIAELLPTLNSGFPAVQSLTAPQARDTIRARLQPPARPEPVRRIVEQRIPGPAGDIGVRIYWGATSSVSALPIVVFAHGGGFVFCDLDTHDGLCRSMANGIGAVVVSVDYRLAPESPWPAAAEDVYATAQWAARHGLRLGGDPSRLVVAGDSAGGNLAAVAAIMARDRGGPDIACQVLLYPVIAADFTTESYRRFGVGFYNTHAAMAWYWDQYVPEVGDRIHPYASPQRARLSGLAPAVVVTAGCDPLYSEGSGYAEALAAAGVPTDHRCYSGAIHGFMTMAALRCTDHARRQVWAATADALSSRPRASTGE